MNGFLAVMSKAAATPATVVVPEGLLTTLLTGLECYWKLDEGSGAARSDSHGLENLSNNGTVGQAAGLLTNSATFGTGNCLTRASGVNTQTGNKNISVSLWFYPTAGSQAAILYTKGGTNDIPNIEWSISLTGTSTVMIDVWQDSAPQSLQSDDTYVLNQWNHVVGWIDVDNNKIGIHVNGGTAKTVTKTKTPVAGTGALSIGAYADNAYNFTGRICEVGRWAKVLTATERASLYNSGAGLAYPFLSGAALSSTVNATDSGGQSIQLRIPNNHAEGKSYPVVLYHHGQGEDQTAISGDALKQGVVRNLLGNGYIVAGSAQHGNDWGSSQGLTDMLNLYNYANANYTLSGRVIHFSQSAGGPSGLLSCITDFVTIPGTKGWFGVYPACNLSWCYANGFNTDIDAAYNIPAGGTYAVQTAGHDPVLLTATKFDNLPMRFYASASDITIDKTNNTDAMRTLVTGHASELVLVTCTGVHGDPSHFRPTDVSAFVARCV